MPIIITYLNPNMRPDFVEGDSWARLDADSPRLGTINLKSLDDGHRIIVNKSAVAKAEEYTKEARDAILQKQKDAEEKQAADAAKAKSDAEIKKKADAALLALLESKTVKGRMKKLFHIK